MTPRLPRRQFIKATATATALGASGLVSVGRAEKAAKPVDKLKIGIIGSGGRGGANRNGVKGEQITTYCDTNPAVLNQLKVQFPDATFTHDWREVVADASLDAVVISTADHHHALAAVAAMKAGKHVYCEKPLGHSVHEARRVREVFGASDLATQMGTQIHAGDNYRRVVELVQGGAIGAVTEAHVWCSRGISALGQNVLPAQPVPEGFDWDLWLGPAPDRDYNTGYWKGGNLNWNRRWDFGNGVLGDMGSHLIDLPWWALQLKTPMTVESVGPEIDPVKAPPWQIITWEHAARPGNEFLNAPVKLVWYHGGKEDRLRPKVDTGDIDMKTWFNGVLFIGEKGMLLADYGKRILMPKDQYATYQAPPPSIPKSLGHYNEWIHAAKTGGETTCNFEYSGSLIEHNLLGNVAHRVGKKLIWNAEKLRADNAPEADAFIRREYRKGWTI